MKNKIKKIISDKLHIAKCKIGDDLSKDMWKALSSDVISTEAVEEIIELLELNLFLPCCHVSGTHDPGHFAERKGICQSQKAEAFERFCKDLSVNPVTRSKIDCGWCADYPEKRKGEGMHLFPDEESKPKKEGE